MELLILSLTRFKWASNKLTILLKKHIRQTKYHEKHIILFLSRVPDLPKAALLSLLLHTLPPVCRRAVAQTPPSTPHPVTPTPTPPPLARADAIAAPVATSRPRRLHPFRNPGDCFLRYEPFANPNLLWLLLDFWSGLFCCLLKSKPSPLNPHQFLVSIL